MIKINIFIYFKYMSNLFEEVLTDAKGVEERLLGPTYPYYKNIKTPSEIGMSDKGTIQQMTKDIDGLIQYVELLVTGDSNASSTGGPLGNKFFLQTGAKCAAIDSCTDANDASTCQNVNRYIYVDNVPVGNIIGVSGLRGAYPGETVSFGEMDPFEQITHIFEPVMTKAIEAKRPSDLPKLVEVLIQVSKEDPSKLRCSPRVAPEPKRFSSGQTPRT
jgi:hypothetical protein